MKRFKLLYSLLSLIALFGLSSCIYENEPKEHPLSDGTHAIELSISTKADAGSTDAGTAEESYVCMEALRVLAYDAISGKKITGIWSELWLSENGETRLRLKVGKGYRPASNRLRIVIMQEPNSFGYGKNSFGSDVDFSGHADMWFYNPDRSTAQAKAWSPEQGSSNCFPAFGMIDIDLDKVALSDEMHPVFEDMGTIWLVRSMAKIVVNGSSGIGIDRVRIDKTVDRGSFAPGLDGYENGSYPKSENMSPETSWESNLDITLNHGGEEWYYYMPEVNRSMLDAVDRTWIYVTVNGREYPLKFTSYTEGAPDSSVSDEYSSIVRNNIYTFEISGIHSGELSLNVKVRPWSHYKFIEEL